MSLATVHDHPPVVNIPPDPVKVIVARVAESFGISQADVLGRRHVAAHVAARKAAWHLLRLRGWSVTKIAGPFRMDHTSVSTGLRALAAAILAGDAVDPSPLAGDGWRDWRPGTSIGPPVQPPKPHKIAVPRKLEPEPLTPRGRAHLWSQIDPRLLQRLAGGTPLRLKEAASLYADDRQAVHDLRKLWKRGLTTCSQSRRDHKPASWRLTDAGREWLADELAKTGAPS